MCYINLPLGLSSLGSVPLDRHAGGGEKVIELPKPLPGEGREFAIKPVASVDDDPWGLLLG